MTTPEEHPILGKLPDGWLATTLKSCCTYIQRGKAPTYVEESPIRALNQRAIRWGYIEDEHLKFHDPDVKIEQRHFIISGDVVVNSTGDITIGRAYMFRETPSPLFADSHVTIVRCNSKVLTAPYLVNLLATPEYQDLIYSMVTGSTGQLELNKSNLENLPILLPPPDVQENLCKLWKPLYDSIALCDALRAQATKSIRLLLDHRVLDHWREARWTPNAGT